jgi:hypothetical protein
MTSFFRYSLCTQCPSGSCLQTASTPINSCQKRSIRRIFWNNTSKELQTLQLPNDTPSLPSLSVSSRPGGAMAQAVSRRPLTAEILLRPQISRGQSDSVTGLSPTSSGFPCHYHSNVYLYIIWWINNMPVGGRSSETQSHLIDINNMNKQQFKSWCSIKYLQTYTLAEIISRMLGIYRVSYGFM